jgi:hypothetical protein
MTIGGHRGEASSKSIPGHASATRDALTAAMSGRPGHVGDGNRPYGSGISPPPERSVIGGAIARSGKEAAFEGGAS